MSDYEGTSRIEELLKAILGEEANLEPPQSRIETLLWAILESGGGSSDYATDISLSMDSSTFVVTTQLKNKDGDLIGTAKTIDIPLEATVVGGSYSPLAKTLVLTLVSGQTISIPIGDIISGLQSEITAQNPLSADLVDDTNATHKFVTAAEKAQIATNASDISDIQDTIGDINTVLEEVL